MHATSKLIIPAKSAQDFTYVPKIRIFLRPHTSTNEINDMGSSLAPNALLTGISQSNQIDEGVTENGANNSDIVPSGATLGKPEKISTSPQEHTRGGRKRKVVGSLDNIDFERRDSLLTKVNLKKIINMETFEALPMDSRRHLLSLLPIHDQKPPSDSPESSSDGKFWIHPTALSNEFFTKALQDYSTRQMNGEFSPRLNSRTGLRKSVGNRQRYSSPIVSPSPPSPSSSTPGRANTKEDANSSLSQSTTTSPLKANVIESPTSRFRSNKPAPPPPPPQPTTPSTLQSVLMKEESVASNAKLKAEKPESPLGAKLLLETKDIKATPQPQQQSSSVISSFVISSSAASTGMVSSSYSCSSSSISSSTLSSSQSPRGPNSSSSPSNSLSPAATLRPIPVTAISDEVERSAVVTATTVANAPLQRRLNMPKLQSTLLRRDSVKPPRPSASDGKMLAQRRTTINNNNTSRRTTQNGSDASLISSGRPPLVVDSTPPPPPMQPSSINNGSLILSTTSASTAGIPSAASAATMPPPRETKTLASVREKMRQKRLMMSKHQPTQSSTSPPPAAKKFCVRPPPPQSLLPPDNAAAAITTSLPSGSLTPNPGTSFSGNFYSSPGGSNTTAAASAAATSANVTSKPAPVVMQPPTTVLIQPSGNSVSAPATPQHGSVAAGPLPALLAHFKQARVVVTPSRSGSSVSSNEGTVDPLDHVDHVDAGQSQPAQAVQPPAVTVSAAATVPVQIKPAAQSLPQQATTLLAAAAAAPATVTGSGGTTTRAFIVDGRNLPETLAMLQTINPNATVTQQQFLLIPSLDKSHAYLCRTPPPIQPRLQPQQQSQATTTAQPAAVQQPQTAPQVARRLTPTSAAAAVSMSSGQAVLPLIRPANSRSAQDQQQLASTSNGQQAAQQMQALLPSQPQQPIQPAQHQHMIPHGMYREILPNNAGMPRPHLSSTPIQPQPTPSGQQQPQQQQMRPAQATVYSLVSPSGIAPSTVATNLAAVAPTTPGTNNNLNQAQAPTFLQQALPPSSGNN